MNKQVQVHIDLNAHLELSPIFIKDDYRKKWNINPNDFGEVLDEIMDLSDDISENILFKFELAKIIRKNKLQEKVEYL